MRIGGFAGMKVNRGLLNWGVSSQVEQAATTSGSSGSPVPGTRESSNYAAASNRIDLSMTVNAGSASLESSGECA
jgi:hypothetical protein